MLLYMHIPFCRHKCDYCAFCSQVATAEPMALYNAMLPQELALWAERLGKQELTSIYLGGGTPTMLSPNHIERFLRAVEDNFSLAPDCEISIEGNPESALKNDFLHTIRRMGVNRLSLGAQSFNDELLRQLGRVHSARDTMNAVRLARMAGFQNISLDLIWGLPGQRLKLWLDDLKTAIELKPEHLSCYGLSIEPDTAIERGVQSGKLELPDEDEQAKMFLYGAEELEARGFLQYEISNYARMGFICRHNMGYWEGEDYLGVGPSAVSTIGSLRWENPFTVEDWARAIETRTLGAKPEKITLDTRIKEMVMLRLRTSRGLRLKAFRELTGRDFIKDNQQMINALHANQLIKIQQGYIRLTKNGMLVSNTILENLFQPGRPAPHLE